MPLQLLFGSNYERAYRHFRSAHSKPLNLAVHLVGLTHIIAANFAMLNILDDALSSVWAGSGIAAALSALSWSALLAAVPAPMVVRALSLAAVALGFTYRASWEAFWLGCVTLEGVEHTLIYAYNDGRGIFTPRSRSPLVLPLMFILRFGLQYMITTSSLLGCLSPYSVPVNACLLAFLVYGSISPFTKACNSYYAGVFGWLAALLLNQPFWFFYGSGWSASLAQGSAHRWTGEASNLPELALRADSQKSGDEHAHTSFFPCLLLQAAHESLHAHD